MRRLCSLAILALLCAVPLGAATTTTVPKIQIFSCQVMSGAVPTEAYQALLAVRFENDSGQSLASIVWRVPYEFGYLDFTDDGTFAQGVRIDNFVLFEDRKKTFPLFESTEDPANCTVVRTIARNGALWLNPAVPQSAPPLMLTATPMPIPPPNPTAPVLVYPCSLLVDSSHAYLTVHFANQSTKPMTDVTFRVPYGSGSLEFKDHGAFAPGVDIRHHEHSAKLDALRGREFYEPDVLQQCTAVSATFSDGTVWQNPTITGPAITPTAVPDSLGAPKVGTHWTSRHTYPTPLPSPSTAPR